MKRRKNVMIPLSLLKTCIPPMMFGIPDDATIMGAAVSDGCLILGFSHESLEQVPEAHEIPCAKAQNDWTCVEVN